MERKNASVSVSCEVKSVQWMMNRRSDDGLVMSPQQHCSRWSLHQRRPADEARERQQQQQPWRQMQGRRKTTMKKMVMVVGTSSSQERT